MHPCQSCWISLVKKKTSDVSALRQIYDEWEVQIRSLESLGVVSDTYRSMLCPILLQMMPEDMALEYSHQKGEDDKWKAPEIINYFTKEEEKLQESMMDCATESEKHGLAMKVLGLVWRPTTDDFLFDLRGLLVVLKERENTQRSVLKSSARILNPLGFLIPFTIRVNCVFQEMWERGLGWDEELPTDLTTKWQQWCSEIPLLHQLSVARRYQTNTRLGSTFVRALHMDITQLKLWTVIVIHQVHSSAHKWKPFVANRVTEIQFLISPESWSHCPGKVNPADLPTRGLTVQDLNQSTLWFNRPGILISPDHTEGTEHFVQGYETNSELTCRMPTQLI